MDLQKKLTKLRERIKKPSVYKVPVYMFMK